jgi:hypothetical protein
MKTNPFVNDWYLFVIVWLNQKLMGNLLRFIHLEYVLIINKWENGLSLEIAIFVLIVVEIEIRSL